MTPTRWTAIGAGAVCLGLLVAGDVLAWPLSEAVRALLLGMAGGLPVAAGLSYARERRRQGQGEDPPHTMDP